MLMPSQSPTSTTTIQTLPSNRQPQQEYVDALSSQTNSTIIKFRREVSMEFNDDDDDNDGGFVNTVNDDIDNSYATFESTSDRIRLESNDSSPASASNEDSLSIAQNLSSPMQIFTKSVNNRTKSTTNHSSNGSVVDHLLLNHRSIVENEPMPSTNTSELDPNVFLISSDTNSHNTIRKTKHDVKRFVMYIDEQFDEQKSLHTLPAESLCRYLKHYFENTTKFDGTQYEPDTLRSFLLSIERYLKSKNYDYNLMESSIFLPCRQVIASKREQWKRIGGASHSNHHHHPASHSNRHPSKLSSLLLNMKNLTVFDRTKPDSLLLEIFVHIAKLCQDILSSMPQLLWGDIELVDEKYLIRRQQKPENKKIRLYATPNHLSTCPVQAYRLYATHRPPQCNTPQSPFFLIPRASNVHHIWYKTSGTIKNFEQIFQNAIQHSILAKKSTPPSSISNFNSTEKPVSFVDYESSSTLSILNGKRTESRISSPTLLPPSKRVHLSTSSVQPLNLVVGQSNFSVDDDSGTASSSPTASLLNDSMPSSSSILSKSLSITNLFHKQISPSTVSPIWDESVTDILLTVSKQRDTRIVKINTLRTYLEEQLGVVEFLCLYRGFKSEPKLTFEGTPWEHYQRFLPVLFTLLALDNTTV